jgi:FO synthase subunit 2
MELINTSPEVLEILEAALHGERISPGDALTLMRATGDDLLAVGLAANKIREKKAGNVATYVVNRNINFTNICVGSCGFCAFRHGPEDEGSYFLDVGEIAEKAREAKTFGATEVCIQGGLHPEIDADFYAELLRRIKDEARIHIHAFSPMEIKYASEKSGLSIKETLRLLKEAGLDSIPGTAAEILDDGVRQKICPKKLSSREWIKVVKEAHRIGIPTTATMLYGHVETPEDQVKHLAILREIQDETGGFTEFIPLSFVHFNAPIYLSGNSRGGATGVEDFRVFAVSRIFLDNFRNIQASWIKLGRKFSQLMLNFGANDLGGTLMEESISRAAGIDSRILGKEELERMIIEAGRVPKQRDTLYKIHSP